MYVTSEATFAAAGVGVPGAGQLVASACLQNVTVIVTAIGSVTGVPVVLLDTLMGDNQNVNLGQNLDTSWWAGAIATGITVPTTGAGASASAAISGVYRGVRIRVTWGTPGSSFTVQVAARDIN